MPLPHLCLLQEPCVVIDYVEIQKWGTNDDLLSLYFLRKGVDEEPCELLLYTLDAAEISAALGHPAQTVPGHAAVDVG